MFSSNTTQVSGGYEIQRSLRFNQADDTYLNRTPASAGTRTTWTWSAWIKRATISDFQYSVFGAGTVSTNYDEFRLTTADKFRFFIVSGGSVVLDLLTTQVFRDPSAWYHFVVAYDSTQATASNRCKLYVNGVQITALDTATYPAQNTNSTINNNVQHTIGLSVPAGFEYNGYQTEINFIDGQALTPSSFGEINADTGVWQPKRYGGSYGTNGFYLNFSNNSNTTAATLGADYSGNGNNWTPNNFSVSAGSGNDSLVDVPTNWGVDTGVGGSVRGNYCTLNPIAGVFGSPNPFSNGNLNMTVPSGTFNQGAAGTFLMPRSGKYYFEMTVDDGAQNSGGIGVGFGSATKSYGNGTDLTIGSWTLQNNGDVRANGSIVTTVATWSNNGDICGVTIDYDLSEIKFYINNSLRTTLSGANFPAVDVVPYFHNGARTISVNFGQRPFAYTAPSGFKALNTQNLPTPTIGATPATQAGNYFNPVLYTGNASTNNISGVGFETDFVWFKCRNVGFGNVLMDRVRGINNARLFSNNTDAESTSTTYINSTNSDGFQLAVGDNGANGSGQTYVAWNWKANGAGVTNTAGSITSTVSANTTSGFSVVTWTGNATAASIGHGLGAVPRMVIQKFRSATSNWSVYTATTGAGSRLKLNSTDAVVADGSFPTTPTSSLFYINSGSNDNGVTMVAYCFAEVPGYSRFGSYTGNGSADGPFVFCGFRPAYLLVKRSDQAYDWWVFDGKRPGYNVTSNRLAPNLSDAEYTSGTIVDFTANGFKIRDASQGWNGSGGTIVFAAFAEAPQKFSLAR